MDGSKGVTIQNVFIRKYGDKAVVMTVTDWSDYKDLMQHAEEGNENPDFMLIARTQATIYSNMNPVMTFAINGEVKDITEETKGMGLASIFTSPRWAFKKIKGMFG